MRYCPSCGNDDMDRYACGTCKGGGTVVEHFEAHGVIPCPECGGVGRYLSDDGQYARCPSCGGRGRRHAWPTLAPHVARAAREAREVLKEHRPLVGALSAQNLCEASDYRKGGDDKSPFGGHIVGPEPMRD